MVTEVERTAESAVAEMKIIDDVDVHRKYWLVPFLRECLACFDAPTAMGATAGHATTAPADRCDAWVGEALRRNGLVASWEKLAQLGPPPDLERKKRGEWFFVRILQSQLCILLELRMLLGLGIDTVGDQLQVLMALACHVEHYDEADQLYELTFDDWGEPGDPRRDTLAKKMSKAMRAVGAELTRTALQDANQPLLGMPFHQYLTYADSRQLVAIANEIFLHGGRVDRSRIRPIVARGHMEKVHLIEAILSLTCADGEVTRLERRMVENVIDLARLSGDEAKLIWLSLETPMSPAKLALRIEDPRTRRFAFETVLVHSQLDGEIGEDEEAFIDELAEAFGISEQAQLEIQAQTLIALEQNPELVDAFRLGGLVRRFRGHLTDRVERAVKSNLDKLVTEIRETGELAQLLVKRANGKLTPDEEARVRAQIVDICKTVPALAVFAVPGGSVLLPILMKLLPFDLMPSAFVESEESL